MKRIFIKGHGLFKFENPFRVKKMENAQMREYFGGHKTPSQETDLN
jgi:hypothetical protein